MTTLESIDDAVADNVFVEFRIESGKGPTR